MQKFLYVPKPPVPPFGVQSQSTHRARQRVFCGLLGGWMGGWVVIFYPLWFSLAYPEIKKLHNLHKHALPRALSRFATGPQREGQAALVHIKIFCTSVRSNLRFFWCFLPEIMFCVMQSNFVMIVKRINCFLACLCLKYLLWIIRTFVRMFDKMYPPKIYCYYEAMV